MPGINEDFIKNLLKQEFKDEASSEFINLVSIAAAIHEHAFENFNITKENFLKWVEMAWDTGKHQRKVYDMEVEGSVMNEWGVAINFGAYLHFHGKREGYIGKAKV